VGRSKFRIEPDRLGQVGDRADLVTLAVAGASTATASFGLPRIA
jgi:hypothetical protein